MAWPALVPLVAIIVVYNLYIHFAVSFFMLLWFPLPADLVVQPVLNSALLLMLGLAYTAWIFAVARGWVMPETGGGFTIAATALFARMVVEMPRFWALPAADAPAPEPYASTLALGRTGGLAAFAVGLALVVAACVAERRWRRRAPDALTRA